MTPHQIMSFLNTALLSASGMHANGTKDTMCYIQGVVPKGVQLSVINFPYSLKESGEYVHCPFDQFERIAKWLRDRDFTFSDVSGLVIPLHGDTGKVGAVSLYINQE